MSLAGLELIEIHLPPLLSAGIECVHHHIQLAWSFYYQTPITSIFNDHRVKGAKAIYMCNSESSIF